MQDSQAIPEMETNIGSIFDTRHRAKDEKRLAVLNAAAKLFLAHGFHRTRLDDIAEALGVTKPALYNYFKNKHEILFACHMLGHDMIEEEMSKIEMAKGRGLDRLKALIRAYAYIMTQKFGMCLVRLDEHELSPKQSAEIAHCRRLVNDRFESYLRLAIDDGSALPCNVKMTTFAITGSLNWVSRWYRSDGAMSSKEIADHFAESLTQSLSVRSVN